jgi:predicted Zn-dependent protease
MQAQHNIHATDAQKAHIARLLLQANLAYGESNSPASLVQRIKARHECRSYLDEVLAQEPGNAIALGLLGRVEMDDGALEKAHTLFTDSLSQDPAQPQQYTNLGYWAIRSERPALAEQYFIQALEMDRQSAAAFCGVAHAKRLQGQFDVAYLHYRKLLDNRVRPQDISIQQMYRRLVMRVLQSSSDQIPPCLRSARKIAKPGNQ